MSLNPNEMWLLYEVFILDSLSCAPFPYSEAEAAESEEEGEDPTVDSLSQAIAFQARLHIAKFLILDEGYAFKLFFFFISPASPNGGRRETEVARCASINFVRLQETKDQKKCILQWWGGTKWLITVADFQLTNSYVKKLVDI